jgi:hypothetical protein
MRRLVLSLVMETMLMVMMIIRSSLLDLINHLFVMWFFVLFSVTKLSVAFECCF